MTWELIRSIISELSGWGDGSFGSHDWFDPSLLQRRQRQSTEKMLPKMGSYLVVALHGALMVRTRAYGARFTNSNKLYIRGIHRFHTCNWRKINFSIILMYFSNLLLMLHPKHIQFQELFGYFVIFFTSNCFHLKKIRNSQTISKCYSMSKRNWHRAQKYAFIKRSAISTQFFWDLVKMTK